MDYQFRTKPFRHQLEEFEGHKDDVIRAIFWEQGTGKSKLEVDNAAYLYEQGKINGVLVVAPNGVHRNWVVEEFPKHLPEHIWNRTRLHCYQTSKANTKWHQDELKKLWKHDGLIVMAMSYDAVMTEKGRAAAWAMLRDRAVLYILDESARIKTPGAKRTKRVVASGKYAKYRRILTGTPVSNSPFDVYSQLKFLDEDFWKKYGIGTFEGFKTQFGVWERQERRDGRGYNELLGYKHLDQLKAMVDTVSTRLTKEDVLDLPPKLYSKRFFDLEPKQRRLYDELRDEFITFLDSGEMVSASLAIVRLLRLQQVCCGYLPPDGEDEPVQDICFPNPRLSLLKELAEDIPHQVIIWARFKRDIDLICDALGREAVRYDGLVDDDGRAEAIDRFQKGDARFFVANAQAAGEGLTLTAARTVIYYSNSFKLTERLQSEDRAHRIGQEHPVNYIDLIAYNTVDLHIVNALASKLDIASKITGDRVREWL